MVSENDKKLTELRKKLEKKYKDDTELFPDFVTIKAIDVIPSPSAIINTISGIGGFPRGRITEIHGPYSSGKGLPLDELVLAKSLSKSPSSTFKFIPMGELKEGDLVKCPDGSNSTILKTFRAKRPVYEITWEDGRTSKCDDQHLWPVKINGRTPESWPYELVYTEDLISLSERYPYIRIPLLGGRIDTGRETSLDPYAVGLMLGDGSFKTEARFSTTDKELSDHMESQGFKRSNSESEDGKCSSWRLTGKDNPKAWEKWRLSGLKGRTGTQKAIPQSYLTSTYENRLALLQGLMDSNGILDGRGSSVSFTNKSRILVEQVRDLAFSLGGKGRIRSKDINGEICYTLDLWMKEPCFRLPRKLERWNPVARYQDSLKLVSIKLLSKEETTQCIKISNPAGLFLMRDFIVTHNTTLCTEVIAAAQQSNPEAVAMFLDFEHAWDPRYARKLGTNLATNRLVFMQPTYFEQGADAALMALSEGLIDILVIDSAAAMTPKSEIEGVMDSDGGSQKGTQAALMAQFLAKASKLLSRGRRPAMVIINQTRAVINIGRTQKNLPKEQPAGGNAIKFYTSLRFALEITQQEGDSERGSKGTDQIYTQNRVRVTCVKNKLAPPFMRGQIVIEYGKGINNLVSLGELAEAKLGIMSGAGFFKYKGDTEETSFSCRGRDMFQELLAERPALQQELEKKVIEAIRLEHAEMLGLDKIKTQGSAKIVETTVSDKDTQIYLEDTEEKLTNRTSHLIEGSGLPLEDS